MGAAAQSLTTGSTTIDLSTLDKEGKYIVRRTLIESLKSNGYFGKKHQRRANYRKDAA